MSRSGFMFDGRDVLQISVTRKVPATDFLSVITDYISTLGVGNVATLPRGTRFFFANTQRKSFMVELAPDLYPIRHENWTRSYKVAMPWQYFGIRAIKRGASDMDGHYPTDGWALENVSLSWSPERVTNENSNVYSVWLPNTYRDHHGTCLGETAPDSAIPLVKRIEDLISGFYSEASLFNDDLAYEYPNNWDIRKWAAGSRRDPFVWKNYTYYDPLSINALMGVRNHEARDDDQSRFYHMQMLTTLISTAENVENAY